MKSADLPKKAKIIKCFHCGNETPMEKVGEYSWGSKDLEYEDFDFYYQYELFACPVCHQVTLHKTYGDETMIQYGPNDQLRWASETETIYPIISVEHKAIPQKIREAYEASLKVKGIDNNVCLMALRRTLELILKDKGATKWGLKGSIEELAEKGVLPNALKEASFIAKIFGDSAAHGKEMDIDKQDVESITQLVNFIIEYLYVIPEEISACQRRIDMGDTSDSGEK